MQLDNKEIIDCINKQIDDYNEFAKGFYEEVKEWKQSSKAKNKKLSDEEKDFETDASNQMHIHSIKDLSPYVTYRLNKVDGDGYNDNCRTIDSWISISPMLVWVFFCSTVLIFLSFEHLRSDVNVFLAFALNYFSIGITIFYFIYTFLVIFLTHHYKIRKKNIRIYANVKAHVLTYYYDQKNFNGSRWQINRDNFLNNMKYIGGYNLLAIRLTEIGRDPTSKEWWKIIKLYKRYCFFMNLYCSHWQKNNTIKSLDKYMLYFTYMFGFFIVSSACLFFIIVLQNFLAIIMSFWFAFTVLFIGLILDDRKKSKIIHDPIKSPIKYVQVKLFWKISGWLTWSVLFFICGITFKNFLWPGCIWFIYIFLFLNVILTIWATILTLHLPKDFNKILLAIKPLFPNDVYQDFVNLTINGIKNHEIPSRWFINRVKRVDKNDKWR